MLHLLPPRLWTWTWTSDHVPAHPVSTTCSTRDMSQNKGNTYDTTFMQAMSHTFSKWPWQTPWPQILGMCSPISEACMKPWLAIRGYSTRQHQPYDGGILHKHPQWNFLSRGSLSNSRQRVSEEYDDHKQQAMHQNTNYQNTNYQDLSRCSVSLD